MNIMLPLALFLSLTVQDIPAPQAVTVDTPTEELAELRDDLMAASAARDSLARRMERYEIAEGFFRSQLGEQTGIFSTIVLILVGVGGFVSWRRIRSEVKGFREEANRGIKEQAERHGEAVKRIAEAEARIQELNAAHVVQISETLDTPQDVAEFKLRAVLARQRAWDVSPTESRRVFTVTLAEDVRETSEWFGETLFGREQVEEVSKSLIKSTEELMRSDIEEVREMAVQLRLKTEEWVRMERRERPKVFGEEVGGSNE